MRHLIDSTDLSVAEIDRVLNLADDIIRDPAAYGDCCKGKILATLFYEPSTRTSSATGSWTSGSVYWGSWT